jgi:hypothetical protein
MNHLNALISARKASKDKNLWQFTLSGTKAIAFGKVIYYDENVPKLTRKYEIWKKFIRE